eukprot:5087738-Pyramimonas_sp.AAC.1
MEKQLGIIHGKGPLARSIPCQPIKCADRLIRRTDLQLLSAPRPRGPRRGGRRRRRRAQQGRREEISRPSNGRDAA